MAEHFMFFDSENPLQPDRTYNAQEFTDYFEALVTTGVMKGTGNQLKVSANGSTMISTIDTGTAFLLGRYYENDSLLALTHETEAIGKNRIDRVVIRMDLSTDARHVKAFVKKGVASTTPVAPSLTQTAALYEISLAQVLIEGGQTFIDSISVTDERGKDIICPWAGSKILPNFDDAALEDLVNSVESHLLSKDNPHQVTAKQVLPQINTYDSLKRYYINPTSGSDDNDGLSMTTAFKTVYKMSEHILPIMLGTTEIIMSGPTEGAAQILEYLMKVRVGGLIEINFAGSTFEWLTEIEGCGAPIKLKNFIATDRLHFKKCAPVYIDQPILNLSRYTGYQEVLAVFGGTMEVWFPTFNQATASSTLMYATEASTMSVTGAKFVNCSPSSRAFSANNSIIMHYQNTVTGTTPIIKTEFGGGRVFTQV